MNVFLRAAGIVLLVAILSLAIEKKERDMAVLLSMMACCMLTMTIFSIMEPVLNFIWELEKYFTVQAEAIHILLKAAGIALITELTGLICMDAGNSALGKTFHILGIVTMLYIALPLFQTFLNVVQEILEKI